MSHTTRDEDQHGYRRLALAAAVGAAVVVWPGWPGPRQGFAHHPPPFERALRWADVIRLRLSPWLLEGTADPADDES